MGGKKIIITIQLVNEHHEVLKESTGSADLTTELGAIRQWFLETYISVKVAAIKLKG